MSDSRKYQGDAVQWRVTGLPWQPFRDLYPRLMGASWVATILWAFAAYVGACLLFAGLYALDPGGVSGAQSMSDLLWFSVQTLSTIGYGGMTPASPFTNLLVILESFIGLAGVAVVTAILYAKFSLPEARIQFADTLAIYDYQGVPTLHFRMVNERSTPVLDAELQVGALIDESDDERRFLRLHDLQLVRSRVPLFAMGFLGMHVLNEESPLYQLVDKDRLEFLMVTVRGIDARTLQPVFTRKLFRQHQVRMGVGFADMVSYGEDGIATLDLRKLEELVPRTLTKRSP